MTESNIALDLLVNAVLNQHASNLTDTEAEKDHASIFNPEELKVIVEALWMDRYSDNRAHFQRTVGGLINEKVSKA